VHCLIKCISEGSFYCPFSLNKRLAGDGSGRGAKRTKPSSLGYFQVRNSPTIGLLEAALQRLAKARETKPISVGV
jgi:hypothetical protein